MEMTMKNLGLTLTMVELELKRKNVSAAKTLMNTYKNILSKLYRLPKEEVKHLHLFENELTEQQEKLEHLALIVDNATSICLRNGEYKDADNLVMVNDRIESSIRIISDTFKFKVNKEENSQYTKSVSADDLISGKLKQKEKSNVLVIVKNDVEIKSTYKFFKEILEDKITNYTQSYRVNDNGSGFSLKTKEFQIKFEKGNLEFLRGKRADYIINLSGKKEIDDYFRNMNKL